MHYNEQDAFLNSTWTTKYGKKILIKDLTNTHLINIIWFMNDLHGSNATDNYVWLANTRGLNWQNGPIPFTYEEEQTPMNSDIYAFTPLKTATRETAERSILTKYAKEVDAEEMRLKFGQRQIDTARQYLIDTRLKLSYTEAHYEYKTIQCIRLVRFAFDLGLKEAKELVESVRDDLRSQR